MTSILLILDQVELEINYSLDTSLSSQVVRPSSAEGDGADIIQMALPADLLYYYKDGTVVRVSPTTLGCSPTPPVMINLRQHLVSTLVFILYPCNRVEFCSYVAALEDVLV